MTFEFRCCYMFLLVNVLAGLVSGAEIIQKFVCPGDSVQAFQNVKFDSCNAVISLYINGARNVLIATWSMQNCILNSNLLPEYNEKLFLDDNGTIWIHNIHPWDQAKYIVICPIDTSPVIYQVQINVMAAPTKDCRPNIMQLGSSLIATLKANNCGKPVVTLYWKGYGGVLNRSEPVLKLTPGKEAGTYYACIEGPSLSCARNSPSLDNCSTFIIGGNNSPPVSSETGGVTTAVFIVVGILVGVLFVLVITVITFIKRRRKNAKVKLRDQESQLLVLTAESQNLKVADVPRGVSDDAHETVFENEERSGGIEVKDMDYDPDSSTAINESEDPSEKTVSQLATHQAAYFVPIQLPDPEHETEELTTEHQPSAMSETMRELQELRDAALCKICLVNKMSMFFMPCKHIATCGNCSISLQLCPLCRAIIEDKMNICFD